MSIQADVIGADVPFLVGLDVLDAQRLQVLTVTNQLQHVPIDDSAVSWALPLVRKVGTSACLLFR